MLDNNLFRVFIAIAICFCYHKNTNAQIIYSKQNITIFVRLSPEESIEHPQREYSKAVLGEDGIVRRRPLNNKNYLENFRIITKEIPLEVQIESAELASRDGIISYTPPNNGQGRLKIYQIPQRLVKLVNNGEMLTDLILFDSSGEIVELISADQQQSGNVIESNQIVSAWLEMPPGFIATNELKIGDYARGEVF